VSATNPGDRELEQLLAETAGLKQLYRASSQDEPPAAMDKLAKSTTTTTKAATKKATPKARRSA
jgi:hypothetical protein